MEGGERKLFEGRRANDLAGAGGARFEGARGQEVDRLFGVLVTAIHSLPPQSALRRTAAHITSKSVLRTTIQLPIFLWLLL
jgi:hypothetical protein